MDEKKPTTLAGRFGGFAFGHFAYSFMLVPAEIPCAMFALYVVEELPWADWLVFPLCKAALMGIYFFVGACLAKVNGWNSPRNHREAVLAVLLPALVAWGWAALVLVGFLGHGEAAGLFAILCFPTLFLAAPSSGFVLLSILTAPTHMMWGGELGGLVWWIATAFWAGLLPPLLFALGSFWQSGRMERADGLTMEVSTSLPEE